MLERHVGDAHLEVPALLHHRGNRGADARDRARVARASGRDRLDGERVTREQVLAERAHGFAGRAVEHDLAVIEHDRAIADLAHEVGRVGDEHDRAALALELAHPFEALALERLVADRQHLVDQQQLGLDVHRDREAEPHVHARRVVLHLRVDELLELGERDDLVEAALEVAPRHAEDRAVEEDVLAAGQILLESRAQLEQRRDLLDPGDRAGRRGEDARDALQERRLARAVVAEQPDGRSFGDVELDVAQRVELLARRPSRR